MVLSLRLAQTVMTILSLSMETVKLSTGIILLSIAIETALICGYSLGADYWDGEGTNGGKTKPHPMVKITKGGGTFKDVVSLFTQI
jgi:hypothetical protein